jgi:hypothetical protein
MFVWLMFVLKIPLAALLWLVWYATRPVEEPEHDDGDGGNDRRRPRHPRAPRWPGPTRRGPHADPLPASPARMRSARGKTLPTRS